MTIKEAAAKLGVTRSALYQWIAKGKVKPIVGDDGHIEVVDDLTAPEKKRPGRKFKEVKQ